MPNWCSNYVSFEGSEENIRKVDEIFEKMIQSEGSEGKKPDFQEEVLEGYYFDIAKQDSGLYSYETRWGPNVLDLKLIGRHCNVSFIVEFEEPGIS